MAQQRTEVEIIKERSNYLRGTLKESLANEVTGALAADDENLIRIHGSYRQADRDLESERKRQKLEPLHSFMIRVRLAGGVSTPRQWLVMDDLADRYANKTLKLTTRQAFQLHGVLKRDLKRTISLFNDALMDSFAACGDVVRNVMCNPNPHESAVHEQVLAVTRQIHKHFTPKSPAYAEIWLDDELVNGKSEEESPTPPQAKRSRGQETQSAEQEVEPIYGKTYLPRKFKIAVAIPPYNDSDVYSNDIGLIAIEENGELLGFNVLAGGGLGTTFGMPETYPRLADVVGFATTAQILDVVEKIVLIQRDNGDRTNRKQARLKYTIDRMGLDSFKAELHERLGYTLAESKPFSFSTNGDTYGWRQNADGIWSLTLFVEGGRVQDKPTYKLKTALREAAVALQSYNEAHADAVQSDFRLTGNQNLMLVGLSGALKTHVNAVFARYGIIADDTALSRTATGLRQNSLACVALNTCALAFAEAERYLPSLIDKLDVVIREAGLAHDPILIRMTGCPNGCARPYLGEIGLIGRAPGRYNLYLGAGFAGDRLNKLYKEMLNEEEILAELTPIIRRYARYRAIGERFGDFVINAGYVKATKHGKDFHA